ncbi:DUF2267 domain-containing protein [Microbulbifer sp. PSTR4-B]|uniref:DUF2267 domain-containing protein n=1 Tax=Microbulbifer sp. PSTR4-B TaxID=3243396 RepID=UPI0040391E2B
MTVPLEYEKASEKFFEYLVDARDIAGLWSTHVTYTMTQGVFHVFRRRISTSDAIAFSNVLPVCLRSLFVADWDVNEEKKDFDSVEEMTREVRLLRGKHNFSTVTAIKDVAKALRKHVDEEVFDELLLKLPDGAFEFWRP